MTKLCIKHASGQASKPAHVLQLHISAVSNAMPKRERCLTFQRAHGRHSSNAVQANDFGSEVIPGAKDLGMHVQAYLYDGYWEDIGTIEAFYQANLALTKNPKPDYRSGHLPSLHRCMEAYMSLHMVYLANLYCRVMYCNGQLIDVALVKFVQFF